MQYPIREFLDLRRQSHGLPRIATAAARAGFLLLAFALLSQLLIRPASAQQDTPSHAASPAQVPPPPPDQAPGQTSADDAADNAAPAPQSGSIARLSDVEGTVRIIGPTGEVFDHAQLNMPVLEGMRVETSGDGRAEIEFEDGSFARLTPNSSVLLNALIETEQGQAQVKLQPLNGLSYYELIAGGAAYQVQIGLQTASFAQGVLLRVNLDTDPAQAAVLRGSAHFESAGKDAFYDLSANQTAMIDVKAATDYDISQEAPSDSWDVWNSDRDQAIAQLAGGAAPGGGGPVYGDPANSAAARGGTAGGAWNDLDYYGSWYDVPGQGMAWAPDGVDQDFDPYGNGAWGYYTGVGYTWVSGYPWGWLPYRCGGWLNQPGYGWLWRPGGCLGAGGRGGRWFPYTGAYGKKGFFIPARLRPPRGIVGPPERLIAVNRGPSYMFRTEGGARPEPRQLKVSAQTVAAGQTPADGTTGGGSAASTMLVSPRQSYRSAAVFGNAFAGGSNGGGGFARESAARPGYPEAQAQHRVFPSGTYGARGTADRQSFAPRSMPAPAPVARPAYSPPPRMSAPSAPMSAPHAAPAAPAGRSR